MNAVVQRLSQLKSRNYVLPARGADYWFGWEASRVNEIRQATGDEFYLILYGSETDEKDFFVIPYEAVQHVLTEANLTHYAGKQANRRRWVGKIRKQKLKFRSGTAVDLTPYYGNLRLLEYAVDGFRGGIELSPDEGDTPDEEAPYVPTGEDSRVAVLRQIKARRGRQKFRDDLRDRYGDLCLISGCRLLDVVEAAHIQPYRGEPDNHPSNGLLLRADLHTLFDLNLIGIEPDTLIVRVHPAAQAEGYGAFDGVKLKCDGDQPSQEALTLRWRAYRRKRGVAAKAVPAAT
jgi:hypothetical protein